MRALGLDVGSKTIGVAVSDELRLIATARLVLRRKGQRADAAAVVELVREEGATTVVVGWPLELDGTEGRRAGRVGAYVDALEAALTAAGLSPAIVRWDERFSTAAAERTLLEADLSRRKRRATIDAVAAQHILQGWLDADRARAAEAGA